MNTLNIVKGRVAGAKRVVIYGPEGIGKSTLGSKFPGALFLDAEDGTGELDVDRVPCPDWRALESAVKNFPAGYGTCVIDTADWAERFLIEWFLKSKGLKSIEDVGWGKGYTQVGELWARFLGDLDALINRGVNVVFVAHSKVTKVSPPDQTDGYDRYELKLSRMSVGPTKEWAQMVLFVNFQMHLVEGTDGRVKAQGGKERVMYATHSAAWDAKNRFDLPDVMPMAFDSIAHVFARSASKPAPLPTPTEKLANNPPPPKAESGDVIMPEQIQKLEIYQQNSIGKPIIDAALKKIDGIDVSDLPGSQAARLITEIQVAMNSEASSVQSVVHVTAATAAWLDQNAEAVNKYLVEGAKWLKPGQTWRDLGKDDQFKIQDRAVPFASAAKIPAPPRKAA